MRWRPTRFALNGRVERDVLKTSPPMEDAANFLGDFNSPTEFTDCTELPYTKTIHENLCSPNNEQSELLEVTQIIKN